jgi:hypothetical protein
MELKLFDLENNKIQKLDGYFLPDSITHLTLNNNKIEMFINIDQLRELYYLWIDSNEMKELPEGIESCRRLNGISALNNHISSLPKGFENFEHLQFLDLSNNKFSPENLDENLWDRLPAEMGMFNISNNNLGELPCKLSKRAIWKLEANDCNLKHICPRIGSSEYSHEYKNYISVKQNVDLEYLSFVPTTIYNVPKIKGETKVVETTEKGRLILITDRSFRDTTRWKTEYKIHTYDFILKPEIKTTHKCQCCARCGIDCGEKSGIIETYMVMDFTQIVETPSSETKAGKIVYDEYGPGEWKTLIKTKMCNKCIDKIKLEVLLHYDDIPLEHKIRERDNTVINSGVFVEPPIEVVLHPIEIPTQTFTVPVHKIGDNTFVKTFNQPNIGATETEAVEEYTEMDGSVWYGEPQQQMNFYDDFDIYPESGNYNSTFSLNNEIQHFNNADQACQMQATYLNQNFQMDVPQATNDNVFYQQQQYYDDNIYSLNPNSYYPQNFMPPVITIPVQLQGNSNTSFYLQNTQRHSLQDVQIQDVSQNYTFTSELNDKEFNRNANRL